MTDEEIKLSKQAHNQMRADLQALVRQGTPTRVKWSTDGRVRRYASYE